MAGVSSATDLQAAMDATGAIQLSWTWPGDIVAQSITFDVYASRDPLDAFRIILASDVAALTADFTPSAPGTWYLSVIAKRLPQTALPSRVVSVLAPAPETTTAANAPTTAVADAGGLAFPFGIDVLGAVAADTGDTLLRSKVLQLLLTSPGERVNLPDFGTRLRDLVFDPNSDVLAATTQFQIAQAIQNYLDDDVQVDTVTVTASDAQLMVDVVYLRKTNLQLQQVRLTVPLPV